MEKHLRSTYCVLSSWETGCLGPVLQQQIPRQAMNTRREEGRDAGAKHQVPVKPVASSSHRDTASQGRTVTWSHWPLGEGCSRVSFPAPPARPRLAATGGYPGGGRESAVCPRHLLQGRQEGGPWPLRAWAVRRTPGVPSQVSAARSDCLPALPQG